MKVYAISGLGADKRVFEYLDLRYELISLDWIEPKRDEELSEYASRLAEKINTKENFILIGVSFGGLIAIEISKILKPALVILISSAETKSDLRRVYRIIGKTGIIKVIPAVFFKPPAKLAEWIFGAKNKQLLREIINETDLRFVKWAIEQLITWDNNIRIESCIKIHGNKDLLIPLRNDTNTIEIPGGHHFMIVDKAEEISPIINKAIKQAVEKARE
ncbi:alpha/beta hydrolase [Rhodocytophaga rosea]|uniref:Alpha/beta hydrolase n=1 Tax=Rhodocytophaga rosea TaxID=2704465 RepID=A0A6C0GJL0_9BACT|nr:alpha/beta hydrolase [Rhodocytophaga rosea]QHT68228.1 alpha/beta hydrolase [Rhodocytophaga rosea]